MSVDATIATWKLSKGLTSCQKFLLMSLADRAGENGECWPGIKRLMKDTLQDRHTIINNRKILIAKGLLEYTGEFKGKTKSVPVMRLTYIQNREGDFDEEQELLSSAESNTALNLSSGENTTTKQCGFPHIEPLITEPISKPSFYLSEEDSKTPEQQKIKETPYVESTYDTAYKTSERTDHFHEPDPNEPFERFCAAYPTVKNKPKCKQLWLQAYLDGKIEDILCKLKEQIEKDAQWIAGYAPNSLKYIESEGWNDDIRLAPTKKGSSQNKQQNMTDGKPSYFDNTSTEWINKIGVW